MLPSVPASLVLWLGSAGLVTGAVGDMVPAPAVADGLQIVPPVANAATPMVVFLDFDGPQIVHGSMDDSHTNTSFIEPAAVDYAPYGDATVRAALVQAVRLDWSPYAVTLTEFRPIGGDYVMAVVSPTNPYAGQAAGIAPLDCMDAWTRNNVVFAFHGANDGYAINEQARTIGQEIAHSVGLEHTMEPTDIMSYAYGPADYWFVDTCMDILTTDFSDQIWCSAQHELFCPEEQQNSHLELVMLLGTSAPDTQSPVLSIVAPLDDQSFDPGASFTIVVEAIDDIGIAEIELFSNGASVALDDASPWSWDVHQIPAGEYELYAQARDHAGNVAVSDVVTILVGEPGESGDDPLDPEPAGTDSSPEPEPEPGDATSDGVDDGFAEESGDGSDPLPDPSDDDTDGMQRTYAHELGEPMGCMCGQDGTRDHAGILALALLALRRRRRIADAPADRGASVTR
jgi:hypothetical protein